MALQLAAPRQSGFGVRRSSHTARRNPPPKRRKTSGNNYRQPGLWKERGKAVLRVFTAACGACLAAALFIGLSVGLLTGYRWMTNNQYFTLTHVEITGAQRLDYDTVLAASKLKRGMNSLALNMEKIKADVMHNPWVAEASVKRMLPGGVGIAVTEREPAFWVVHEETLHYADAWGRIIAPVAEEDRMVDEHFVSLPVLRLDPGSEALMDYLPHYMATLRNADAPFAVHDAAWVRLSAGDGVELFFEEEERLVRIGAERWEANVRRLQAVWRDLSGRGELEQVRTVRAHGPSVWVVKGKRLHTDARRLYAAKGGDA